MPPQLKKDIDQYVVAVQKGDIDAFRPVVDALIGRVRAFVVGRSLPGVDVDDVVQRAFVEAFTGIGDYEVGTDFAAWVITIARYQLLRETSRLRRAADYHRRYAPVALASASERALTIGNDNEEPRLDLLRDCVEGLPDSGREVLRLRYESGQSISEIADALDRSAGAIRKQLCLLRKQLHECVTRKLAPELQ